MMFAIASRSWGMIGFLAHVKLTMWSFDYVCGDRSMVLATLSIDIPVQMVKHLSVP